jgi:hypothetical protein
MPDETLTESFRFAYNQTLSRHHTRVMAFIFDRAMSFCPDRDAFYEALAQGDSQAALVKSATRYLVSFREVEQRLVRLCVARNCDMAIPVPSRKRGQSEDLQVA